MFRNQFGNKGILAIEILIAVFIIVVALSGLLRLISFSLGISVSIKQVAQANDFAQETMEAVRNFRDNTIWDIDGLGALIDEIAYFPRKTDDSFPRWGLIQGEENINGFNRKVVFEKVYRDANGNIVQTGSEDFDSKKVIVNVSWQEKGKSHQVELISYLTNWSR